MSPYVRPCYRYVRLFVLIMGLQALILLFAGCSHDTVSADELNRAQPEEELIIPDDLQNFDAAPAELTAPTKSTPTLT